MRVCSLILLSTRGMSWVHWPTMYPEHRGFCNERHMAIIRLRLYQSDLEHSLLMIRKTQLSCTSHTQLKALDFIEKWQ